MTKLRDRAPRRAQVRCLYCRDELDRSERVHCAECLAPHHEVCFLEHGRCSAMGCETTEVVRGKPATRSSDKKTKARDRLRRAKAQEAESAATASLVLGALSVFLIILGPVAVQQAAKAKAAAAKARVRVPDHATIGGILGWVTTGLLILVMLYLVFMVTLMLVVA